METVSILPCHLEDRDKELSTEVRLRKKITAQDGFANFTFPRSDTSSRLHEGGMKLVLKGAVVLEQLIYQSLTTIKIHSPNLPKSSIEMQK